jgi:hypothetical protein
MLGTSWWATGSRGFRSQEQLGPAWTGWFVPTRTCCLLVSDIQGCCGKSLFQALDEGDKLPPPQTDRQEQANV